MQLVADGSKFRSVRKVTMVDLVREQRRAAHKLRVSARRKHRTEGISKYHDELDKLYDGRVWLPAGVDIDSISYVNVLNLRKIINHVKAAGRHPSSLWQEGGELIGVRYTDKSLANACRRLSKPLVAPEDEHQGDDIQNEIQVNDQASQFQDHRGSASSNSPSSAHENVENFGISSPEIRGWARSPLSLLASDANLGLNGDTLDGDIGFALCPLSIQVVDSLDLQEEKELPNRLQNRLQANPNALILAPVNLTRAGKHWALAVVSGKTVHILNSISGYPTNELKARLQGMVTFLERRPGREPGFRLQFRHKTCLIQVDGVSSGVAVMVKAFYVVAGRDPPGVVHDYNVWLRILSAFVIGGSLPPDALSNTANDMIIPSTNIAATAPFPPPNNITKEAFKPWMKRCHEYETEILKAARKESAARALVKETVFAAAELYRDLRFVGRRSWAPLLQSRPTSTNSIRNIEADYPSYSSALCSIRATKVVDLDAVKLQERMDQQRMLQARATFVMQSVVKMAESLRIHVEQWPEEHLREWDDE
ncbi:hypothetical protein EsH8_XI_000121 [Colletotrichum jinshuiense]